MRLPQLFLSGTSLYYNGVIEETIVFPSMVDELTIQHCLFENLHSEHGAAGNATVSQKALLDDIRAISCSAENVGVFEITCLNTTIRRICSIECFATNKCQTYNILSECVQLELLTSFKCAPGDAGRIGFQTDIGLMCGIGSQLTNMNQTQNKVETYDPGVDCPYICCTFKFSLVKECEGTYCHTLGLFGCHNMTLLDCIVYNNTFTIAIFHSNYQDNYKFENNLFFERLYISKTSGPLFNSDTVSVISAIDCQFCIDASQAVKSFFVESNVIWNTEPVTPQLDSKLQRCFGISHYFTDNWLGSSFRYQWVVYFVFCLLSK